MNNNDLDIFKAFYGHFGQYFGPEHLQQIINISKKALTPPENKEKETNEKLKKK